MASKTCIKCKEELTLANFIGVNSILHSGSLPICRKCLARIIEENSQNGKSWNIVNKILQWADIPFVTSEWEKIYKNNKEEALGVYISIFRKEQYKTLDWTQYNEAYLQLEKENRVMESIPEIKEAEEKRLRNKWGHNYEKEQLEYLENLHSGLMESQNIIGALNEDQAKKLCRVSLIIEEKIRAGVDITKDLKAYDDLTKLANFSSKTVKAGEEFESIGEIFAYLEKTGWVNHHGDKVCRDEVDKTEQNLKNWVKYLYVNENGIGEEIEQRIHNLKVAAELEGDTFDEDAFRQYVADESREEFEVDI